MITNINLREMYALIDEYGGVFVDSVGATPEMCKANYDRITAENSAKFAAAFPDLAKAPADPNYPVTADDWIKQGSVGLVRIKLEVVEEKGDYFKLMMTQPPPSADIQNSAPSASLRENK